MSSREDLPELDANELALLAAFAEDEQLGAPARERVKARVLESTAPIATRGTLVRGPWVPWVAGTVLAAAAAALLVLSLGGSDVTAERDRGLQQAPNTPESAEAHRAQQETARSKRKTTRATTSVAPVVVPPPEVEEPPTDTASAEPDPVSPPAPTPRTPRRGTAPSRKAPPMKVPAAATPTSLAEETRLLERARRAVMLDRPADALSLLRDAQNKFPDGVLRQERAALRVVALCDSGKLTEGRKAAAAFLRTHPKSALRSRVQSACPDAAP